MLHCTQSRLASGVLETNYLDMKREYARATSSNKLFDVCTRMFGMLLSKGPNVKAHRPCRDCGTPMFLARGTEFGQLTDRPFFSCQQQCALALMQIFFL